MTMSELDVSQAAKLLDLPRSERVHRLFGFEPFGYQADVLDAEANRVLWVCGRQVGKTETASAVPADHALTRPGEDVLIAAKFQETANELFRRTKDHLEGMGPLKEIGVETPNKSTYEFDTGSRIMARTLGNDGRQQRGKVPSCIVVEEAALVDRQVYDQVLRPMFATHDDYELLLITTPRGQSGYIYERWLEADASDQWEAFRNPTSDNPLVDEAWLESEREQVDDLTWRQEYLGEFVPEGDVYIPRELAEPCIRDEPPSRTGAKAWLGVDVARSGSDRSVYLSVDSDGNVFDIRLVGQETVNEAVGRIKALNEQHGYRAILIDENAVGGGVVDFSAASLPNVEPITFSSKSKQQLYQTLKRVIESRELALPDHERLVHELTSLQYDFTRHGVLRVEHPPGGRDDFPDALALAVRGWQQSAGPSRREVRRGPPGKRKRATSSPDDNDGADETDDTAANTGSSKRVVRRRSPTGSSHNGRGDRASDRDVNAEKKRYWEDDR